ncbi:BREX-1 system adenine-specific DNA-methyltransferase PglX [Fodinibius salsisoli]|uniref:site-specific DNA-methyltransferase (adenine-specific) n=1 Tax=Fodinibius salsisoli TaxID=2820877 RepID=A0ABT3PH40_9BACT|nr:BREX-1 system adenine-specific DNA-methyltransferase PglX [Fodinibius salsisoli]MCW9705231.1 BREX-1 system adenine-specific DNA-methyltransferase PglX [Fodinibius salsisoli]
MDTKKLKKFAQETRRKLLKQVEAKLDHVLEGDTSELRAKASIIEDLKKDLGQYGRKQLIDKMAYTWFNRFVALRYMDANGFQPFQLSVLTPENGQVSPELLQEAMGGHIPGELKVDQQQVMDILDGRTSTSNPENEAYRLLLIGACNHLHEIFPFLFEPIDDYTELLLPDDLISEFSIIRDVVEGMSAEDCQQVEVLGWLYQYYISEKNSELISAKKKYKPEEIGPATQLFTPRWIVEYMTDNTLGQYWLEMHPSSSLKDKMDFYIKPPSPEQIPERDTKKIEEITFLDPCAGSGHILSYAFDLFYSMYEEEGYPPSEIPELIIKNNLYGLEIDERAAQLASLSLMFKAREYQRRFFSKGVVPNIVHITSFEDDEKLESADSLGSLINITEEEADDLEIREGTIFEEQDSHRAKIYDHLSRKYDLVVTNPPYVGGKRMNKTLKNFLENNYSETKSDLFATFIVRCLELAKEEGLTGYMSPFVWMFISSYEDLRTKIIDNHCINSLIQLEYSGFDGATVPVCTFTIRKEQLKNNEGNFIRLSDFKGAKNQPLKTLEAINNPDCYWFHVADQENFEKIPGRPIGYWVTEKVFDLFETYPPLSEVTTSRNGMTTGKNARFLRKWYEVNDSAINLTRSDINSDNNMDREWVPYNKGGKFRKWYGNIIDVLNWTDNGAIIKNYENSITRNTSYYFKEGITWTLLSSSFFGVRILENGAAFDVNGMSMFLEDDEYSKEYILGFMCSKLAHEFLKTINPTLAFQVGDINRLPFKYSENHSVDIISLVNSCISIAKSDWYSNETTWGFKQNELIRIKREQPVEVDIEETLDLYTQYWSNRFKKLHGREEQLNRQFIEIYGLNGEISPEIPLKEITIQQSETKIKDGTLSFKPKEVLAQFVSYAVGCMFGRYSLDKEGLILANQGETLEDYLNKVEKSKDEVTYLSDDDNIIPVLDDEWFEDDIVSRFHQFLKASFGEENFQKNLAFVEENIKQGDIRKYFDRSFYRDHYKRYSKRPIYWKFTSPKGHFSVLVYMHRYTPDTLNNILNNYLREFIEKLETRKERMKHQEQSGSTGEKASATKEIDKLNEMIKDCKTYEREILYPLASERIEMDLDDGVLVNYNLFGQAVEEIRSVNDKKKKKKVADFDWVDGSRVR